jgi:hypothetical protein
MFSSGEGFSQQKETIFLHLDKEIYLPGETIWFKAYVFAHHVPSASSTNFYASLYNKEGILLMEKQFPLFEGTCNGDFYISDSLKDDALQLRVFTKNGILADSNNALLKAISVYQKNAVVKAAEKPLMDSLEVHYFVEGGSLVSGISNFIGIKVENSDKIPASIGVAIMDELSNNVLDSIVTGKDGMGKCQFLPEAGKTYKLVWQDSYGNSRGMPLGPITENGVGLHSEISGNKLYYSIQKSAGRSDFNNLHLSIKQGNEVIYGQSLSLNGQKSFVNSIVTDSLPFGILQLQLSGENGKLLQEKQFFLSSKIQTPQVSVLEKSTLPKGKNKLEIWMPDTLLYNLSLSIADESFYDSNLPESMYDALLLNDKTSFGASGFAQAIQAHDEKKTDLFLLANGQDSSEDAIQKLVADDYLSMTINTGDSKHVLPPKSLLTLIIQDNATGKQFLTLPASTATSFKKSGFVFYDSAKAYFKLIDDKDISDNLSLSLLNGISIPSKISPLKNNVIHLHASNTANFNDTTWDNYAERKPKNFNEVQTIKEVVLKSKYVNPITKRITEIDKKYTSGMFSGLARGYQLNVLDDPDAADQPDIFNYIKYRIPGLTVSAGGVDRIRQFKTNRDIDGVAVILFINETETLYDMLEVLPVSQVAYVKYVPGIVIGSSFVSNNGALYVYTKKGDDFNTSKGAAMKTVMLKGYNSSKEFASPDYSEKTSLVNPDNRTTLYWNPYIITDKSNRKISVEYYNNDISTRHLLILRGFGEDGTIVELKKWLE